MLFDSAPPEELSRFQGFLLVFLGARHGQRMRQALEPFGVHPRHLGLLTLVESRPGCTQQQLSALTGIDSSSMVAVLDDLEQRGLAERRTDPNDRRKRSIHLTAEGRAVREQCMREGMSLQKDLLKDLDADERAELLRLLRKLSGLDVPPES